MLKLYNYFRSSASYRVRIALHFKNLNFTQEYVHLMKEGGQQLTDEFRALNPQCLVPTLVDDQHIFTQSMAILEYLEEKYPKPALLPQNSEDRAQVRAMSQLIACDIHPLNNLRVLKYLKQTLNVSDEQKTLWLHHWMLEGFHALESLVKRYGGQCCFGDAVSFADVVLIPQLYNAKRFACPLTDFPRLLAINEYCLSLLPFDHAHPQKQGDAE